jgi:hypothetical protein
MLPLAELPALPLHEAGKYVAGAYVVLFAMVLVYLAIMAIRLAKIERELGELLELAEQQGEERGSPAQSAETADGAREPTLAYPMEGQTPIRGAGT